MLRLFGLMFDLFWVHLGFPRSESILGNLVLWDSMLGALGLRFGSLDASKGSILRVLGSLWAPFLVTFEGPEAPGHAPVGLSVLQGRPGSIFGAILGSK